jgi:hypothetical protein
VLALPTALLAGSSAGGSLVTALSIVGFLISGCLVPTWLTILLVRSGRASALDLRERNERFVPSVVTAVGCGLAAWVLATVDAPRSITDISLAISIQMALLAVLTTRWKVSYHTASATGLVLVGRGATGNPIVIAVLLALAVGIAWPGSINLVTQSAGSLQAL